MITIVELARFRAKGAEVRTGEDFANVGLAIMGGCESCGASIACYNAYPSRSGYWRCEGCVGDSGYETVEEADAALFGEALPTFWNWKDARTTDDSELREALRLIKLHITEDGPADLHEAVQKIVTVARRHGLLREGGSI